MKKIKHLKRNLKLITFFLIAEIALLYLIHCSFGLSLDVFLEIVSGGIILPFVLDNFKETFDSSLLKLKGKKLVGEQKT